MRTLAQAHPAYYVAFDVLQVNGHSILTEPWERRRDRLEGLFADHALSPPWTLCPSTRDPAVAREWLETWTRTPGIEGVVVKGIAQPYRPGTRGWVKVRARETTEAVVGAITGTLGWPRLLVLGRYDADGRLRYVGETTEVSPTVARELARHLTPAGPGAHPWEGARFSAGWGRGGDVLDTTLVVPERVRRSASTRPRTGASGGTPSGSSGCAWTCCPTTCSASERRRPGSRRDHGVRTAHLARLDAVGQLGAGLLRADRPQGRAPGPAVTPVDLRGGDAYTGVRDAPGGRGRAVRPGGRRGRGRGPVGAGLVLDGRDLLADAVQGQDELGLGPGRGGRSRIGQAASVSVRWLPPVSRRSSTRAAGLHPAGVAY
ncbi:ATP-dependent DNA ligase [Streptomyces brevispora]